jgi:hypothetical protein
MNKSKLKNRILYKPSLVKKIINNEPISGVRRGPNYIQPDSSESQNNDFSDIFGIDSDLAELSPSSKLFENTISHEKEDSS